MVNDCRRRLEAAYQEMVQILVNTLCTNIPNKAVILQETETDFADTDEYKAAKALVDEIKLQTLFVGKIVFRV